MSKTSRMNARRALLDSLLSQGIPMSQSDIFRAFASNASIRLPEHSDFEKWNRTRQEAELYKYQPSFRKDIEVFKLVLAENGMPDMLVTGRGGYEKMFAEGLDMRTRTYCYKEKGFSILPFLGNKMTDGEYRKLLSSVSKLKGVLSESVFDEVLFAVRSRIEADFEKGVRSVDYEDNLRLKGRHLRPLIDKAIRQKQILEISYETFEGRTFKYAFHPYLLKQYNNRWFLFCYFPQMNHRYFNIPLDRIVGIPKVKGNYEEDVPADYMDYFKDIIGVTRFTDVEPRDIILGVTDINAWGRLVTKPLNTLETVQVFDKEKGYGRVKLHVAPNMELYMSILSLGRGIAIESEPDRSEMAEIIRNIASGYGFTC